MNRIFLRSGGMAGMLVQRETVCQEARAKARIGVLIVPRYWRSAPE